MTAKAEAFIDKLPNELLCAIIKEAIIGDQEEYCLNSNLDKAVEHAFPPVHDLATLSSITLVCDQWNQCLLSLSEIWATAIRVDHDSLARTKMIVERARNQTWRIQSSGLYPLGDQETVMLSDTWMYIFENMESWGSFSLEAESPEKDSEKILDKYLRRPAPQLTAFALKNLDYPQIDAHLQWILPEDMFSGSHKLKIFIIRNVILPLSFKFDIWMGLTVLKVEYDNPRCVPPINAPKWLEILRNTKQLQILEICGFKKFDQLSNHDSLQIEDVSLNYLSHLSLETFDDKTVLCDLFSKLVLPATCTMVIIFKYNRHIAPPPPSNVFEGLKIGLERYSKSLRSYYSQHKDSWTTLHLALVSDNGKAFTIMVTGENSNKSIPVVEHLRIRLCPCCPSDVVGIETVPIPTTLINLEDIPQTVDLQDDISSLIPAFEYLSPKRLKICLWQVITVKNIVPLWRLFSSCVDTEICFFSVVDPVLLRMLRLKRNMFDKSSYLLPEMQKFDFLMEVEQEKVLLPYVTEFLDWRRSIGKPPKHPYYEGKKFRIR